MGNVGGLGGHLHQLLCRGLTVGLSQTTTFLPAFLPRVSSTKYGIASSHIQMRNLVVGDNFA